MPEEYRNGAASGDEWVNTWSQFYNVGQRNWNNWLLSFTSSDTYTGYWNQYAQTLLQYQEMLQHYNQRYLQALGLPTRQDISRANRQYFEVADRLDELENGLSDALEQKVVENQQLVAQLETLREEIARLKLSRVVSEE